MLLCRALILICISPLAFAQAATGVDLAKPTQVKIINSKVRKKKRPEPQKVAPVKEDPSLLAKFEEPPRVKPPSPVVEWGGEAVYGVVTDLADQFKPRLYVHSVDFGYGLTHNPTHTSLGMGMGVAYNSVGDRNSEITVNSNEAELFVSDVSLSVAKLFLLMPPFKLSLSLDNEFPTSPEARREGYNSITSAGIDVIAGWLEKRIVGNLKTGYTHIWNSYRFSPATQDLNKRSGWKTSLSLKLKIWEGLFLSGSVGTQLSTYVDGTTDQTYRNSVSAGYSWERFTVALGYSNGTYLNQEDATIWFIDEYRQTASLRMLFSF